MYAAYSDNNTCIERENKCNGNCEGPFRKNVTWVDSLESALWKSQ